ncbi:hypothetical protein LX15_000218 [Streptoalloteichus tenebrarius]|uniref:Uncharacterized protein n=1 Tax=Streptoalloteichus tenebrarius (strain ATCC 17920 / DSM 40477 / JCM 4838 / CBS 697.72 / NBRC 16177 / NCIMB 11028 / NRRL B-12390 / A12253. 1 / ISP 5477) TaxID=1933 RepID=A0ABT1HM13_STRSD|nr:hypothetical protein [Streptoalloteichus tenebrarius]MCP2256535.1 hypothetical protein [Streptoalloteichus tenebrarius]
MAHAEHSTDCPSSLIRFDLHFPPRTPFTNAKSQEEAGQGWEQFLNLVRRQGILDPHHPTLPLAPTLTGLDPVAERTLLEHLTHVLRAVDRLARHYAESRELQRFLGLPPFLHECALSEPPRRRHVDHCRFDLGGARLDQMRVFEVGGDYPISNLSGLLNRYWRQADAVRWLTDQYRPARCEEPGWMMAELLDLAAARGIDPADARRVAVLCPEELRSTSEIRLLEAHVRHHRRTPVYVLPEHFQDDDVVLGFLPHITQPFVEDPDRYAPMLKRVASGNLVVFNGVLGRLVAGNKLVSAMLSDPRFRHVFTPEQRASIDALIPWSRKLGDGITADEALAARADLVVKAPFDVLSRSVFVGRDQEPAAWREVVETGARQGWLAQEFAPSQYVSTRVGRRRRTLGVVFCGGRPVGYNGRLTTSLVDFLSDGGLHAVFGDHTTGTDDALTA